MKKIVVLVAALSLPGLTSGHHSFAGRFDTGAFIELEGVVTAVHWRNPHILFILDVTDETGQTKTWEMESGSPTLMQRAGIPPGSIAVGQTIRVAANPPLTDKVEAFATNVLLPDGQELVMQTGARARFAEQFIGDFSYRFRTEGDRSQPELGLFRMWTFTGADGFLFPESINRNYDLNNYPMTAAAREVLADFDPATDNPTRNCTPKGMPTIMEQPLPMEIVRDGENVVFRIEEYDLSRTIHMDRDTAPADTPYSHLGYSTGYFEGETLVVHTDHINWPWFNQSGIPLSTEADITERFTPIEDGSMLAYEMTIVDPVNFTAPVVLSKNLLHVPGVEILPFECDEYQAN
jgi:hypothetical protein